MTDHELEQRIRTAVEHAAPDRLNSILSSCERESKTFDGQKEGAVIDMSELRNNKNSKPGGARRGLAAIAAVAAAFVLCFGGYQMFQRNMDPAVDSVVMLDVNPSLSLYVDDQEKVLSAEALNDDAKDVLGNMELKDTSLEVAVNAIIGSMLQKGYLGDAQNSILVSVENEDAARGEALQQKVTQAVTSAAQNGALDAAVLSQLVSPDDAALAELAEQYHISMGKAALIQEVIAQVPTLTFEDLAPMTINEIALITASKNVSSETVTQSGTASDKAYIGQEEALKQAYAHAGVAEEDVLKKEVDFDSENGVMVYEVDFDTATMEYEYEINALTGEVLKVETEGRSGTGEKSEGGEGSTGNTTGNAGSTTGNTGSATGNPSYIGETAAKKAALSHAGVAESDTTYLKCYLEYDDGKAEAYAVEFKVGKTEYEYEIDLYSGAVLDYDVENHDNSGNSGNSATGSSASGSGTSTGNTSYIGENAALAAALKHAGVGESSLTKKQVELDTEDNVKVYDVEFETSAKKYEYTINATTGAVVTYEAENQKNASVTSVSAEKTGNESASNNRSSGSGTSTGNTSYIGENAALAAALKHAGVQESSLTKKQVKLEEEKGAMVYEVEFKVGQTEYEYQFDAVSGAVLKAEQDVDD